MNIIVTPLDLLYINFYGYIYHMLLTVTNSYILMYSYYYTHIYCIGVLCSV